MSISVGSNIEKYTYSVQTKDCGKNETVKNNNETREEVYLKELQEKNSEINIIAGSSDTSISSNNYTRKTDVRIAPGLLSKMSSDPQVASKYEKMLSEIPGLDKWADSMIKAMTGSEVKYRQVWIDEDGNMGSFCVTGPSEEQKKKSQDKKIEDQEETEKIMQKRKEKQEELEEWLNGNLESLPIVETDISQLIKSMDFNKKH